MAPYVAEDVVTRAHGSPGRVGGGDAEAVAVEAVARGGTERVGLGRDVVVLVVGEDLRPGRVTAGLVGGPARLRVVEEAVAVPQAGGLGVHHPARIVVAEHGLRAAGPVVPAGEQRPVGLPGVVDRHAEGAVGPVHAAACVVAVFGEPQAGAAEPDQGDAGAPAGIVVVEGECEAVGALDPPEHARLVADEGERVAGEVLDALQSEALHGAKA